MAWFASEDLARYRKFQHVRAPLGFSSAVVKAPNEGAFTIGTVMPIATSEREVTPSPSDSSKNVVPLNQRLTLSIAEASQLSGLPRQFVVNSIQSNKLKSVKIGRSTLVKRSDLEAFVKGL
jgi:excisionase family DNA binding protein